MQGSTPYTDQLPEEKHLLLRIAGGDKSAFTTLMEFYWKRVFDFSLSLTKSYDLSEELTQELFIHLWEKRILLAEVVNVKAYLYTSLKNRLRAEMRKKVLSLVELTESTEQSEQGADHLVEVKELEQILGNAIAGLPEQQRAVFTLNRIEGLSYKEIATQLGVSEGAVCKQLSRAVTRLRHELKEHGAIIPILLFIYF